MFIKFPQSIPGIMTKENVSGNFDIWNICPMESIYVTFLTYFFSCSNLRCQYLLNQSEYRKSLTHTCWLMPFEWDCAAILLMQQHPMPERLNRRTLGHFMPYWLLTSDQDRISPYNMNKISSMQVMRIEMNINHGIINWSNTKFSELTS